MGWLVRLRMSELVRPCKGYARENVEGRDIIEEELKVRLENTSPEEYLKWMDTIRKAIVFY